MDDMEVPATEKVLPEGAVYMMTGLRIGEFLHTFMNEDTAWGVHWMPTRGYLKRSGNNEKNDCPLEFYAVSAVRVKLTCRPEGPK